MKYPHRIAVGAIALAAALTPAYALANTSHASHHAAARQPASAPAPAPHNTARHAASSLAPAARHNSSRQLATAAPAVASPAPAPGTTNDPVVLKYDRDSDLLDTLSNADFERGISAWVACMNTDGLPIQATSSGVTAGGWTFGPATTARAKYLDSVAGEDASIQIQDSCLDHAYSIK